MLEINSKIKVLNKEYTIKKLLGHGKGGYSFLAEDKDKLNVVLKKIHHEPCSYYNFEDKMEAELQDYQRLSSICIPLPKLLTYDKENEIIIKEYVPGKTIFEMIKDDQDISLCLQKIKEICKVLYKNNLNIDYFPTNFIYYKNELYYVDYECNNYMEEWNFENWGVKYWSKTLEFLKCLKAH